MLEPSVIIDAVHILYVQMCAKDQLFRNTHVSEAHAISRHRNATNELWASSRPGKQLSQRWKFTVNVGLCLGTRGDYTLTSNCFKIIKNNQYSFLFQ